MSYTTITFLIFLPAAGLLYYIVPKQGPQNAVFMMAPDCSIFAAEPFLSSSM